MSLDDTVESSIDDGKNNKGFFKKAFSLAPKPLKYFLVAVGTVAILTAYGGASSAPVQSSTLVPKPSKTPAAQIVNMKRPFSVVSKNDATAAVFSKDLPSQGSIDQACNPNLWKSAASNSIGKMAAPARVECMPNKLFLQMVRNRTDGSLGTPEMNPNYLPLMMHDLNQGTYYLWLPRIESPTDTPIPPTITPTPIPPTVTPSLTPTVIPPTPTATPTLDEMKIFQPGDIWDASLYFSQVRNGVAVCPGYPFLTGPDVQRALPGGYFITMEPGCFRPGQTGIARANDSIDFGPKLGVSSETTSGQPVPSMVGWPGHVINVSPINGEYAVNISYILPKDLELWDGTVLPAGSEIQAHYGHCSSPSVQPGMLVNPGDTICLASVPNPERGILGGVFEFGLARNQFVPDNELVTINPARFGLIFPGYDGTN